MIENHSDSRQDANRIETARRTVYRGRLGAKAPVIYVINAPEHPFAPRCFSSERDATVVTIPVQDWADSLTPWPAPGLHRDGPPFGGHAQTTLSELLGQAVPHIERTEELAPSKRAICGYSLGGLFALYTFTHSAGFDACACLSGSLWYEDWVGYLQSCTKTLDLSGKYAFFSVGSKEKKAGPQILRTVEDDMLECARICRACGCEVETEIGPGNHAQHVGERFARGLEALDSWLFR